MRSLTIRQALRMSSTEPKVIDILIKHTICIGNKKRGGWLELLEIIFSYHNILGRRRRIASTHYHRAFSTTTSFGTRWRTCPTASLRCISASSILRSTEYMLERLTYTANASLLSVTLKQHRMIISFFNGRAVDQNRDILALELDVSWF